MGLSRNKLKMNNKVLVKTSGAGIATNFDAIAKLLIASNDTAISFNGATFDESLIFDLNFAPSDVSITATSLTGELPAYTPYWLSKRQDLKSVRVDQLPKAVEGQGICVLEATEGLYENYFENSYVIPVDDKFIRIGVSNFTQSEDNNPFSAVTTILYFKL